MVVGVFEVVGVSLKKVERDARGGVSSFGAWYFFQYSLAKALRCLSVKCLHFFFGEEVVLHGLKRAAKASRVARFLFVVVAGSTWSSVAFGGMVLGLAFGRFGFLLRSSYFATDFADVDLLLNLPREGWCLFHTLLFLASAISWSKSAIHFDTSCSILYRSPMANWTRSASKISLSGLSGSRFSLRMWPSHCHFLFRMAVTMSKD